MSSLTYSDYLYRLIDVIEALGCTFDLYNKEKQFGLEEFGGRISYTGAKIWIHCPWAPEALRLIAHEGGHWVAYLLHNEQDFPLLVREAAADHYGWDLLCVVGADELVSHAHWLEECRLERKDEELWTKRLSAPDKGWT